MAEGLGRPGIVDALGDDVVSNYIQLLSRLVLATKDLGVYGSSGTDLSQGKIPVIITGKYNTKFDVNAETSLSFMPEQLELLGEAGIRPPLHTSIAKVISKVKPFTFVIPTTFAAGVYFQRERLEDNGVVSFVDHHPIVVIRRKIQNSHQLSRERIMFHELLHVMQTFDGSHRSLLHIKNKKPEEIEKHALSIDELQAYRGDALYLEANGVSIYDKPWSDMCIVERTRRSIRPNEEYVNRADSYTDVIKALRDVGASGSVGDY